MRLLPSALITLNIGLRESSSPYLNTRKKSTLSRSENDFSEGRFLGECSFFGFEHHVSSLKKTGWPSTGVISNKIQDRTQLLLVQPHYVNQLHKHDG